MHLPAVAIPIGVLLSPFRTRIEKFFLLETYLTSHREYMRRSGFLVRWEPIGTNLEVSLSFPSVLDNDRVPMAQIAVRRMDSDEPLDRICLLIEAESALATHQESVTLFRVGARPVITALPSIPLRTFHITEDLKFIESMNQFRIYILETDLSKPQAIGRKHSALITHPNTIDLLNDRFEERWGTYWNMAAIDSSIQENAHGLTYHLASPKMLYGSGSKVPLKAQVGAVFRTAIGCPLCWLLNREWLLKAYFWIPILIFRRKFKV